MWGTKQAGKLFLGRVWHRARGVVVPCLVPGSSSLSGRLLGHTHVRSSASPCPSPEPAHLHGDRGWGRLLGRERRGLGGFNNRHLFSHTLGSGRPRSKCVGRGGVV